MKSNKQVIKIEGVEFRRSHIAPNLMIGSNGTYYFIYPHGKRYEGIRHPSKMTNSKGYPTQAAVCIGCYRDKYGIVRSKVVNMGRLVLDAFNIKQPDSVHREVDHIDKNPYNNNLSNLRWASRSENCLNRNTKNIKIGHDKAAKKLGFNNWGEYMRYCRSFKAGLNDGSKLHPAHNAN